MSVIHERFSRWVFRIAGIYGIIFLTPMLFMEHLIGVKTPPAIAHPEYFYGFLGVALAWQVGFLIIGSDPKRFYPLMPACVLEKFIFGFAVIVLYVSGRCPTGPLAGGCIDLILGTLFTVCWVQIKKS